MDTVGEVNLNISQIGPREQGEVKRGRGGIGALRDGLRGCPTMGVGDVEGREGKGGELADLDGAVASLELVSSKRSGRPRVDLLPIDDSSR